MALSVPGSELVLVGEPDETTSGGHVPEQPVVHALRALVSLSK
jgi:hypothetical protein